MCPGQAGLKAFTAAFVIGSGCAPIWGDTLPVTNDPTVTSEITTAESHLGRLAFWSVDRDQPCGGAVSGLPACSEISQQPLDFTKIFLKYTG
jgi:hypothetical protein